MVEEAELEMVGKSKEFVKVALSMFCAMFKPEATGSDERESFSMQKLFFVVVIFHEAAVFNIW